MTLRVPKVSARSINVHLTPVHVTLRKRKDMKVLPYTAKYQIINIANEIPIVINITFILVNVDRIYPGAPTLGESRLCRY